MISREEICSDTAVHSPFHSRSNRTPSGISATSTTTGGSTSTTITLHSAIRDSINLQHTPSLPRNNVNVPFKADKREILLAILLEALAISIDFDDDDECTEWYEKYVQGGNRESMDEMTAVGSKFGIPSVDDTMETSHENFLLKRFLINFLLIERQWCTIS